MSLFFLPFFLLSPFFQHVFHAHYVLGAVLSAEDTEMNNIQRSGTQVRVEGRETQPSHIIGNDRGKHRKLCGLLGGALI
jgi:hypothetical protein